MRRFQRYLQKGKRSRHSNSVLSQKMCRKGHNAVRKAYGNLGGKWEMGQESECTEHDKDGSGSEGLSQ
jgi:hypothetical protein